MRTHILFGLVTTALVAATVVTPQAQDDNVVVVRANLHGGNEVPGVSTGAHGFATVTLNRSTGEVSWVVDVYNLPTGVTAAHIHVSPPGVNGPVVVNFNPQPTGVSGDFRIQGSSTTIAPAPALGILTMDDLMFAVASGNAYVNVHTQAFGGGEIRGQTCPASAAANTFSGISLCTNPQ
jgi:hypothetical protein